jgi:Lipocalin-like domain
MKTLILGIVFLLALPLVAPAGETDLHGTWKLVSLNSKLIDTGEVDQPRGKAPKGYVMFSPDGHVMGITLSEKRPKPENVAKLTDQQRVDLFNTINAYAATYKLEGNKLTYRYDVTHNELTERAAAREIKIEGNKLTIVNEPAPGLTDGKMRQTTTVWEKEPASSVAQR